MKNIDLRFWIVFVLLGLILLGIVYIRNSDISENKITNTTSPKIVCNQYGASYYENQSYYGYVIYSPVFDKDGKIVPCSTNNATIK